MWESTLQHYLKKGKNHIMKPAMTVEQARQEVEAIRDRLGKPVDAKIQEFLVGLRRWGVETTMSCEGHYFGGYQFPWVDITAESLPLAATLLMLNYRRQQGHKPFWVIEPTATPRIRTLKEGCLRLPFLKREAVRFGIFLQELPDNYLEEEP